MTPGIDNSTKDRGGQLLEISNSKTGEKARVRWYGKNNPTQKDVDKIFQGQRDRHEKAKDLVQQTMDASQQGLSGLEKFASGDTMGPLIQKAFGVQQGITEGTDMPTGVANIAEALASGITGKIQRLPEGLVRTFGINEATSPSYMASRKMQYKNPEDAALGQLLRGVGGVSAPAMVTGAALNPLAAIAAMGTGYLGGKGLQAIVPESAPPETKETAGMLGNITGGILGGGIAGRFFGPKVQVNAAGKVGTTGDVNPIEMPPPGLGAGRPFMGPQQPRITAPQARIGGATQEPFTPPPTPPPGPPKPPVPPPQEPAGPFSRVTPGRPPTPTDPTQGQRLQDLRQQLSGGQAAPPNVGPVQPPPAPTPPKPSPPPVQAQPLPSPQQAVTPEVLPPQGGPPVAQAPPRSPVISPVSKPPIVTNMQQALQRARENVVPGPRPVTPVIPPQPQQQAAPQVTAPSPVTGPAPDAQPTPPVPQQAQPSLPGKVTPVTTTPVTKSIEAPAKAPDELEAAKTRYEESEKVYEAAKNEYNAKEEHTPQEQEQFKQLKKNYLKELDKFDKVWSKHKGTAKEEEIPPEPPKLPGKVTPVQTAPKPKLDIPPSTPTGVSNKPAIKPFFTVQPSKTTPGQYEGLVKSPEGEILHTTKPVGDMREALNQAKQEWGQGPTTQVTKPAPVRTITLGKVGPVVKSETKPPVEVKALTQEEEEVKSPEKEALDDLDERDKFDETVSGYEKGVTKPSEYVPKLKEHVEKLGMNPQEMREVLKESGWAPRDIDIATQKVFGSVFQSKKEGLFGSERGSFSLRSKKDPEYKVPNYIYMQAKGLVNEPVNQIQAMFQSAHKFLYRLPVARPIVDAVLRAYYGPEGENAWIHDRLTKFLEDLGDLPKSKHVELNDAMNGIPSKDPKVMEVARKWKATYDAIHSEAVAKGVTQKSGAPIGFMDRYISRMFEDDTFGQLFKDELGHLETGNLYQDIRSGKGVGEAVGRFKERMTRKEYFTRPPAGQGYGSDFEAQGPVTSPRSRFTEHRGEDPEDMFEVKDPIIKTLRYVEAMARIIHRKPILDIAKKQLNLMPPGVDKEIATWYAKKNLGFPTGWRTAIPGGEAFGKLDRFLYRQAGRATLGLSLRLQALHLARLVSHIFPSLEGEVFSGMQKTLESPRSSYRDAVRSGILDPVPRGFKTTGNKVDQAIQLFDAGNVATKVIALQANQEKFKALGDPDWRYKAAVATADQEGIANRTSSAQFFDAFPKFVTQWQEWKQKYGEKFAEDFAKGYSQGDLRAWRRLGIGVIAAYALYKISEKTKLVVSHMGGQDFLWPFKNPVQFREHLSMYRALAKGEFEKAASHFARFYTPGAEEFMTIDKQGGLHVDPSKLITNIWEQVGGDSSDDSGKKGSLKSREPRSREPKSREPRSREPVSR